MSGIVYYIEPGRERRNTAGLKAPEDVGRILGELGYEKYPVPCFPGKKNKVFRKLWLITVCTRWWLKLIKKLKDGDTVIYQHPLYGNRIAGRMISLAKKRVKCSFIAIVHDLESLRGGIAGVTGISAATNEYSDNTLLKLFNIIICHNDHMKQYMIDNGFDEEKLVCIELFDYLTEAGGKVNKAGNELSIAIAGNLAIGKCAYIYNMHDAGHNAGLKVHLYGNNYQSDRACLNMIYHGSFSPEELPAYLEGDYGLVWDGSSSETCAGNTGEYLKFNSPHKTSLYLAAGMPVIVWNRAAIADFVREQGVGITVESLYDLETKLNSVDRTEYEVMLENSGRIGRRLKCGYYTKKAIKNALAEIDERL